MIKNNLSVLLMVLFLISSCVGTIEETNPEETNNSKSAELPISFAGVTRLIPISHNKIEVYFERYNGAISDLSYQIYINKNIPVEIKAENLIEIETGEYKFTLRDLSVNTEYSISVGVYNRKTGQVSNVNNELTTKTFSNFTADFSGVSAVSAANGSAGTTSLVVSWSPAKSTGVKTFPSESDPIAYIITYMKASDGSSTTLRDTTNPKVISKMVPSNISASSFLSEERERTIQGLEPDTEYYVNVRAVHKAYANFSSNSNYKFEENNQYLKAKTLKSNSLIEWDSDYITIEKTNGVNSLSSVNVKWAKATGPFYSYRIVSKKVGTPSTDPIVAESSFSIDDSFVDSEIAASRDVRLDASKVGHELAGLDQYSFYKLAVIQCYDSICSNGNRKIGKTAFFQVLPKIAPFNGIVSIEDPNSIANKDKLNITFDAPLTDVGILTNMKIMCHQDASDTSPVVIPFGSTIAGSGKSNCEGLQLQTNPLMTLSSYKSFKNINVVGTYFSAGQTLSSKNFCFSIYPEIVGDVLYGGANYKEDASISAIIKCIQPKINVPTAKEFPGLTMKCEVGDDNTDLKWVLPTKGLFSKFVIFYKVDNGDTFRYADAIKEEVDNVDVNSRKYKSIWGLSSASVTQTIASLEAGRKYQFGILSYVEQTNASDHLYSEFNANILGCTIPLPTATFDEWVDVFAIGPKGDGRISKDVVTGKQHYIFETINSQGQPIEVEVENLLTGNYVETTKFVDQFGSVQNVDAQVFNGVLGAYNGDTAQSPRGQFSNSGIVRIGWKDVTISKGGGKEMWQEIVDQGDDTTLVKKDRKYGYNVYRSDDNQKSWIKLTGDYEIQRPKNLGLIHPVDYIDRALPNSDINDPENKYKAVIFTDYSLKKPPQDINIERARVLYYKVIPVVNDFELTYDNSSTYPQNIVKVILPPANMAYVSRLMANRQTCRELGKTYEKLIEKNYQCEYNGAGAKATTSIPLVGVTNFDFGSDLLMDRFELGCNVTRGATVPDQSTIASGDSSRNFYGKSNTGANFRGCYFPNDLVSKSVDISGPNHPSVNYDDFNSFRVGDCYFDQVTSMDIYHTSVCSAMDNFRNRENFIVPGIWLPPSYVDGENCLDADYLYSSYFEPYKESTKSYYEYSAQSEYLAVAYNQRISDGETYGMPSYPAKDGSAANSKKITITDNRLVSSCMINIPVKNNASTSIGDGRIMPRWISANKMNDLSYEGSRFDITNKSVNEIETNSNLFDTSTNLVPTDDSYNKSYNKRYDDNTKIAKIIASNNAKLPPLDGIPASEGNNICKAFEVQVGVFNETTGVFKDIGATKKKRLLRRNEGVIAGAWPKTFDEARVTLVEKTANSIATENTEVRPPNATGWNAFIGGCNTYERSISDGISRPQMKSGDEMTSVLTNAKTSAENNGNSIRPPFITGSSFFDPSSTNLNSQNCVSRYGVQDLVGNLFETSTDTLFCGTKDEDYIIKYEGVTYTSSSLGLGRYEISSQISYDSNKFIFEVNSGENTGQCGIVEYESGSSSPVYSSYINPAFDLLGNRISSVVPVVNTRDPKSILDYRSGDGYFIGSGKTKALPPLSLLDTWGLVFNGDITNRSGGDNNIRGKYFNPVVGLPMECDGSSCSGAASDNSTITTPYFFSTMTSDQKLSLQNDSFPIGNSQILSTGMSTITGYNYFTTNTIMVGTVSPRRERNVWVGIDNSDPMNPVVIKQDLSEDDILSTPVSVYYSYWGLGRNSLDHAVTIFNNFGGRSNEKAGRYSLKVDPDNNYSQEAGHYSNIRCVVKLDE